MVRSRPWTLTPQLGLRVTHIGAGRFIEDGSELALAVDRIDWSTASLHADIEVTLDARPVSG